METSCLIIGGGIGGLFTAAFLAKNGVEVTVLEKNHTIGGGLQCFKREGKYYETGMHVIGGFNENGSLKRICEYLGILDKINIHHIDERCMDDIVFGEAGEVYEIPSGKDNFIKKLSCYFPHEKEALIDYIEEIYSLTREIPLFYLEEDSNDQIIHSEKYFWSADRLIEHYIKDEKLQDVLAYQNPLYGGVKGHTPAYIHAVISVLYINGSFRLKGGGQHLADELRNTIVDLGGTVKVDEEVLKIIVNDNEVRKVISKKGNVYSADYFVSSVHPTELLRLLPSGVLGKAYERRLNEIPVSCSAFSLFIDLKPDSFKFMDQTRYYYLDSNAIWNHQEFCMHDWPKSFVYFTPPDVDQGTFASKMIVNCLMDSKAVEQWRESSVGRRDKSYYRWKDECTDKILSKLEELHPGFKSKINKVYSSSPLTIRDYYNTKEGSLYGYLKDCDNLFLSQISVKTRLKNLYLTGQNVFMHGMCGVPLTAILTAEAILGKNTILNEINHD